VLDGAPTPFPKGGRVPQFSAHVYCGQTAGWIKMPLGTELGLSPNDIVLHGDPAPPQRKVHSPSVFGPCLLWPNGSMYQDSTWYRARPHLGDIVLDGDPAPPPLKGHSPQFLANVRCGQTAGWTKIPLGMEIGLGLGDFV